MMTTFAHGPGCKCKYRQSYWKLTWNRLTYPKALKRLKYAYDMVTRALRLTHLLVLIQLSRTLEYCPSPSSEMLKHQKGFHFGLRVVEQSYTVRHFSPVQRIFPDLVVFFRLREILLFKINIFSYFCRKRGSGGLNLYHKNVK